MLLPWLWASVHAVMSALATVLLLCWGRSHLRLDLPGERRSHQTATPRGGGLAIVLSVLIGDFIAVFFWPELAIYLFISAIGLALIAWIGWLDDRRSMPIRERLMVHAFASALLAGLVYFSSDNLISAAYIFVCALVLINVWNFMDGINGLAVSQTALIAFVYTLTLPLPICLLPMALGFACVGFIPFNFPKARLFLGDSGSCSLGYSLATCLSYVVVHEPAWLMISWLPLSVFLVDAGLTLCWRIVTGEHWWKPHAQHVYQRAARCYASHTPVTLIYFFFSSVTCGLFIFAHHLPSLHAMMFALLWGGVLSICWLIFFITFK